MSDSEDEGGIFGRKRRLMKKKFQDANKEAAILSATAKEVESDESKGYNNGDTGGKSDESRVVPGELAEQCCHVINSSDNSSDSILEIVEEPSLSTGIVTRSRRSRGRGSSPGRARGRGRGKGRARGRGSGRGRGRGRKSDVDVDSIFKQLDEEDNLLSVRVSDQLLDDSIAEIVESKDIEVKFMFRGELKRVFIGRNEKVYGKIDELADLFKISDPMSITICFRNKIVPLDSTPMSLELTVADILDCLVKQASTKAKVVENPNEIRITFRDSTCVRSTGTEVSIGNDEELLKAMKKYAEMKNLDLKKLIFEFDGEKLNGSETPEDLDMESGSLVDVREKN